MVKKAFIVAFFVGVASISFAKMRIVSTVSDFAYFASVIGGDKVEVSSILRGDQDPHFASAKPSYMLMLSKADLVLSVGLDLEIGWLPLVLQGARNPKVMPGEKGFLDCSQFIEPIEVPPSGADRSKGDLHPKGNPHYWLPPKNAKKVAKGIMERMSEIDPSNQKFYEASYAKLEQEINEADAQVKSMLSNTTPRPIVTYHVTFSYLFMDYGLRATAYIEPKPGIPPTPSHIASLTQTLQSLNTPPVFIIEPYYEQDIPNRLARQTNGKVIIVPTSVGGVQGANSYKDVLVMIAKAIATQ